MRYGRLVALLVILSSISLFIGVSNVQLSKLLQLDGQSLQILLVTRLPRTICLILVGATSSICGLIMQHLTQNKFVSPTTALLLQEHCFFYPLRDCSPRKIN